MKNQRFEQLPVWQVAIGLAVRTHEMTEAELNPVPPRVYKYGVFGDGDPHF